jgi:hypothetical protein
LTGEQVRQLYAVISQAGRDSDIQLEREFDRAARAPMDLSRVYRTDRAGVYSDIQRRAASGASGQGYKDGGPVMEMRDGRMVPKVGTRSPRPGSAGATGGGMSREAILQALDAPASAPAAAPRQQQTMRHLQIEKALKDANAYRNGGPVKKRKNYMGGGKVTGPGGPRSDSVPAWLSPGEHVIAADEVAALGGGDMMRGHNALLQFRGAL